MFDKSTPKTLTKKEAYQYLNIGREQFNAELRKGNIAFLPCGGRIKFTIEDLERWRNNTINHTGYTKEEKRTMRISPLSLKRATVSSLEALQDKYYPKKPHSFV